VALQSAFAASKVAVGQLLMSGRFAVVMGVLVANSSSGPAGTPCVPTRCRTAILSSSAALPLKLPQCPSWPERECIVICQLTYSFPADAVHRLTWTRRPSGDPSAIFTCTIFFFLTHPKPCRQERQHCHNPHAQYLAGQSVKETLSEWVLHSMWQPTDQ